MRLPLLSVLLLLAAAARAQDNCGTLQVDMVIVLDGSGSICDTSPDCLPNGCPNGQVACSNWNLVQDFMASIVDRLTIGDTFSRVGLVTFANNGVKIFDLNTYNDKASLRAALQTASYPGGNTHTADGLRIMHQDMFTAPNGDRPNVMNVALVITDGISTTNNQLTLPEAQAARSKGIMIYSIGITTQIDEEELRGMSSLPQVLDQNYFTSPDFDGLTAVLDRLLSAACVTGTPATTPAPTVPPVSGCRLAADVVIIVDSSGSIREDNFDRLKSWLTAFVNTLPIDEGQTRVGLVTFGNNEQLRWHLDRYNTRSEQAAAIAALDYSHGTTNTGAALRYVRDNMFSGFNGDRAGAGNVALVLTDGGSNDKERTWDEALSLKTHGVHLITVGLGDWVDLYELRAIASHPFSANMMEVVNYDNLGVISQRLKDMVCNNVDECLSFPCRNGGQCEDGLSAYYCRCVNGYAGPQCEYRCESPADVVFALDASGSITKQNFEQVVAFTKSLITQLPVDSGARVGLMTYSDNQKTYYYLKDYTRRQDLMEASTIPYFMDGSTNTAGALQKLRDDFFTTFQGDNAAAPNVAVVVTDGYSNDLAATLTEARQDRGRDISIIVVGVGDSIRPFELEGIASWPVNNNVYTVPQFSQLPTIITSVRDAICNAVNECQSNPCRNGGTCWDVRQGYWCECATGYTGRNCGRACSGIADIAIILDISGSIRFERFEEVKQFLSDIINELEVEDGKVRVALITFHDDARLEFGLTTYTHIQDIQHHLMGVEFGGGRTNIAAALEIARGQVFRSDQGDRPAAQNMVYMFTDGSSNIRAVETIPLAIDLKIDGVHITVTAVGRDLNELELQGIASLPTPSNLLMSLTWSTFRSMLTGGVASMCNSVNECLSFPCQNGGQCVDGYNSYRCVCGDTFTGQNCERTCRRQHDVAFLLDFSGSVDNVNTVILAFVRRVLSGLEFRRDQVRAALITFADDAQLVFRLDKYSDVRDVLTALAFQRSGGRTNTQAALELARTSVFQTQFGDRPVVPNKVILLTDGGSNIQSDQTVLRAADLKNNGVDIHVVAIGDQVDLGEVNQVASGTAEPFVYRLAGTSQVTQMADALLTALCT